MSTASSQSEQERLREIYADLDPYNLTRYETIGEETKMDTSVPTYRVIQEQMPVTTTTTITSSQPVSQSSLVETKFALTDKIINSSQAPLDVNVSETVCVNDQSGVYANKQEELEWQGPVKIKDYPINVDNNPEVIRKQTNQVVNYVQPITIKYLKPPSPPRTGEIVIKQESDMRVPRAPPLIIRQRPVDPSTPETLILREQPPQQPFSIEKKCISIAGKLLPPPPRKLVIEKLPQLPVKPQPVVIEKWLPYDRQTRCVKYVAAQQTSQWPSEKNLVICWDSPKAVVSKELHTLGTVQCDTEEYRRTHGNTLLSNSEMLNVCREHNISLPENCQLNVNLLPKLEGDIDALKLIDLDRHGLSEYKYLFKSSYSTSTTTSTAQVVPRQTVYMSSTVPTEQNVYESVFRLAHVDYGMITDVEAKRLISLINEKLGKTENTSRTDKFVQDICNKDNKVDFIQFKKLVVNWVVV